MAEVSTLASYRALALSIVERDPGKYDWAKLLPVEPLDKETAQFLSKTANSPMRLIERCNPFTVAEQLSDLHSLTEIAAQLRTSAHAVEANFLNEVIGTDFQEKARGYQQIYDETALAANIKSATGKLPGNGGTTAVGSLYDLEVLYVDQRKAYQSTSGHPFNLGENVQELRRRYISVMYRLLGKAEAVRLLLRDSFGLRLPPFLSECLDGTNPIPGLMIWLRDCSIALESVGLQERISTIYRLLASDRLIDSPDTLGQRLMATGPVTVSVPLTRQTLGLRNDEVGRIIAFGIAPAFNRNALYTESRTANEWSAYMAELRASQRQQSFDAIARFSAVNLRNEDGDMFNFPALEETYSGIGGWCIGVGPAQQAVSPRSTPRLTNRPIGGHVDITLANEVRANWGLFGRNQIAAVEADMQLRDILIAITFAGLPLE